MSFVPSFAKMMDVASLAERPLAAARCGAAALHRRVCPCPPAKRTALLWRARATGRRWRLRAMARSDAQVRVGGLRQATVRRTDGGARLSVALHAPRGDLQQPAARSRQSVELGASSRRLDFGAVEARISDRALLARTKPGHEHFDAAAAFSGQCFAGVLSAWASFLCASTDSSFFEITRPVLASTWISMTSEVCGVLMSKDQTRLPARPTRRLRSRGLGRASRHA